MDIVRVKPPMKTTHKNSNHFYRLVHSSSISGIWCVRSLYALNHNGRQKTVVMLFSNGRNAASIYCEKFYKNFLNTRHGGMKQIGCSVLRSLLYAVCMYAYARFINKC